MTISLCINSVYVPPGEFDYEGGIEAQLHGVNLGIRVQPIFGTWDFWTPGRRVAVTLYLRKQGSVKRCEPYVPAQLQRLGRWTYHVEGRVEGIEPDQIPYLAGFPEIEVDRDVVREGWEILAEGSGLFFIADLWGEAADG